MANMSYCRFENTVRDLSDCLNAIEDAGSIEELQEELSPTEKRALISMLEVCESIIDLNN